MGEVQSEKWREKGVKQSNRKEDIERRQRNKELSLNKDTGKGSSTRLCPFCLSLSINSFLPLLFLVVLVCLTLSCPLTLPCFLWAHMNAHLCACVLASHMECYQGVRHRAVTHWQSPPTPGSHTQAKSWLDWASDRAQHGLTADTASLLKGQTPMLHHIWNSL